MAEATRPASRSKELRFALVCYGGVSLAIYMHGITREMWKLLRASEARNARGEAAEGDTEAIWGELLAVIGETVELRVVADIIAGASAGGINGILLAQAIVSGASLEPLRDMWLDGADSEKLLDREGPLPNIFRKGLSAIFKEPVAWFAGRQSRTLAAVDDDEVRHEIAGKLTQFVRSRWFHPPFSGKRLLAMVDEAMDHMAATGDGRALVPPTLAVDLFVTATDYHGRLAELPIHSPPFVMEREHRRLFSFHAPPVMAPRPVSNAPRTLLPDRKIGEQPALLFAARATACFPGAFAPANVREIDQRLQETGRHWPGRDRWLAETLPGERPPEDVMLIDGSVLNNAPFEPAIDAVSKRPAHREVDRRFVYIDPKPGISSNSFDNRPPSFFTTILRALADIPREQPIRDSLEAIDGMTTRVQRLKRVIDGMSPAVDAAIERAIGARFFLLPLSEERVARVRSRTQTLAAREAGFAFAGYAQLKLRLVVDEAATLLAVAACRTDAGDRSRLHTAIEIAAGARGAFDHEGAIAWSPERSGYVQTLRGLDVGFRIRRLRFLIRRLAADVAQAPDGPERTALEAAKSATHAALAPYLALRSEAAPGQPALEAAAKAVLGAPPGERAAAADNALDTMIEALGLDALDRTADSMVLTAAEHPDISRDQRRSILRNFLGFPFYDIAILPLLQGDASDSFEEIRVDRISPDDATALREGGTRASLKGWQLNAFGGFFSRAWRENDYLWGRLHAAERLVDILLSSAAESGAQGIDAMQWKKRLFLAILASERPHLQQVQPLLDELEQLAQAL